MLSVVHHWRESSAGRLVSVSVASLRLAFILIQLKLKKAAERTPISPIKKRFCKYRIFRANRPNAPIAI
jgi:hypothetical protein